MTDTERDDLRALFESVTGDTAVVETQRNDVDSRTVAASMDTDAVDAIDHHGFGDVIDVPERSTGTV